MPQASGFIQSIIGLDRLFAPQQALGGLDLYRTITGGVRDAQGPLTQSLARRAEMLGAEGESLLGPLSFLDRRDADQLGFGQAVARGRGLGNLAPFLADRQRAERRDQNLRLAGDLFGEQRATANLLSNIESGIYGSMAPDIGVDAGSILGIAGTDIQNILGERAARQYSDAIREGARREQQAKVLETGIGLIPKIGFSKTSNLPFGITFGQ